MASRKGPLLAFFFLVVATVAAAQLPSMASWPAEVVRVSSPVAAPAPAPSMGGNDRSAECLDLAVDQLIDCLVYVENGSKDTKPSKSCCEGFSNFTISEPLCLCDIVAKNSTIADNFSVNRSKALTLPDACRVKIPPIALCSAVGYEIDIPGVPQPPPFDKCTRPIVKNMVDCISYTQEGGPSSKPNDRCCSGYSNLLDSNQSCLCKLILNSTSVLPRLNLDVTRTYDLPNQCNANPPNCTGQETPNAPSPGTNPPPESNAIRNFGGFSNVLLVASYILGLIIAS